MDTLVELYFLINFFCLKCLIDVFFLVIGLDTQLITKVAFLFELARKI